MNTFFFETKSHTVAETEWKLTYVAQAGLDLTNFLPQPLECWVRDTGHQMDYTMNINSLK